jgi:hypothetical protein
MGTTHYENSASSSTYLQEGLVAVMRKQGTRLRLSKPDSTIICNISQGFEAERRRNSAEWL